MSPQPPPCKPPFHLRTVGSIPGPLRGRIILKTLTLLRQLKHVEFTGMSLPFAAKLSNITKSNYPVIDLLKMYDSLENYAHVLP